MILAVFTAIGIGMALPYFVLAAFPQASAKLDPTPRGSGWSTIKGSDGLPAGGHGTVALLSSSPTRSARSRLALIEGGLLFPRARTLAEGKVRASSCCVLTGLATATLAVAFSDLDGSHQQRNFTVLRRNRKALIEWQKFAPGEPAKLAAGWPTRFRRRHCRLVRYLQSQRAAGSGNRRDR